MLLTGLYHSHVVSIPLLFLSNSFILPLHLPTQTRVKGNDNNPIEKAFGGKKLTQNGSKSPNVAPPMVAEKEVGLLPFGEADQQITITVQLPFIQITFK